MAGISVNVETRAFSLVARMYALVAQVEEMRADNLDRSNQGLALAWPGHMFSDISGELNGLAEKLDALDPS